MKKKFCDWQVKMDEVSEDKYVCGEKLGERRCTTCNFTADKIQYGQKYGDNSPKVFYISQTGKPLLGECQDFELPKDITEILKKIPDKLKLLGLRRLLRE